MPRSIAARPFLLALAAAAAFLAVPRAQSPPAPDARLLREARPGEIWITAPTIGAALPAPPRPSARLTSTVADVTPPTAPGNLTVELNGLFRILARWDASSDPESGIDYYAFALGTGTTPATEANVRYWQSTGVTTTATISMALVEGATYYLNVRASNGANLQSTVVHSAPLVPARVIYGAATNAMTYVITPTGFDAAGGVIPSWSATRVAEISDFMNKMLPVLADLYGPPSTSYAVKLVRDQRYVTSAIFFPSTDEIHVGDSVTYQLLTHEMVHALRRDRILSSNSVWQYEPTLSGFEEGFAQAVSYGAMNEFAKRYPSFGLTQQIYGSSHEWDYDFQNVPQLRTTDFWSDSGGMNLHYMRYEVAAAAIAKIEIEHPGFYKAFNAEYYRRLNLNPVLTTSRALMKEIVQTVAPVIEGRAAADWIDRQYVFTCANFPGNKVWVRTQHYPATEYFIFNYVHLYETFSNGSDWAIPLPGGGYRYYGLNGSTGTGTLRNSAGSVIWQQSRQITPVDNPPVYFGFGSDEVHLTTQASNQPWPGGDAAKFVTSMLPLDLYSLTEQFTVAAGTVSETFYRVMGAPLRRTTGVFGGVTGANGGRILLRHHLFNSTQRVDLTNAGFWVTVPWASLDHPATQSNDSVPGMVDVTYINAAGTTYSDRRAIGLGNSTGSQLFLFDVAKMTVADVAPAVITQPQNQHAVPGGTVTFTVAGDGSGSMAYQWQRKPAGSDSFVTLTSAGAYSGTATASMTVTTAAGMSGDSFRCVITNHVGATNTASASLTLLVGLAVTSQPVDATVVAGLSASFTVTGVGFGTLTYEWQRRPAGATSFATVSSGGAYAGTATATLTIAASAAMSGDSFRCLVRDATDSVTSAAAVLTVIAPPSVSTQPSPVTAAAGTVALFTIVASGSPPLTYQWQRRQAGATSFAALSDAGGSYSGVTSGTLAVAAAAGLSGDDFRCVVSNSAGTVTSDAARLTVASAPVIVGHPAAQVAAVGGNPRFVVTAAGTAPLTYQWQRKTSGAAAFVDLAPGGFYAGTTAGDLSITAQTSMSGEQFRCVVSNSLGSVASDAATLTVGTAPQISSQPSDQQVVAEQNISFTVAVTGTPAPALEWQVSSDGGIGWNAAADGAGFSGSSTATLTVLKAPLILNGLRVRARASNALGAVTSGAAALTVTLAATATPGTLNFGASRAADGTLVTTGRQFVAVEFGGTAAEWTAVADQPWLQVTGGGGKGSGRFGVAVVDPGGQGSGPLAATIRVNAPSMSNSPVNVAVSFTIVTEGLNTAPSGAFDTPVDNATGLTGSIAVTGWALDDVEVTRVRIVRDPVPGEPAGAPIYLGDAALVEGARPDVAGARSASPRNTRAGWGYLLLTNFLPGQGTGTYTLHAYADDGDGHSTLLGTRTITCTNVVATAPFGAIDTPGQGETVSGVVNNFGWVLSPGFRRADPLGGGTVTVYIDGAAVGTPSLWASRPDLLQMFPSAAYAGITYALGVFTFDTRTLANGVHTISWLVTDNSGEAAGIGSRYFTVANGAAGSLTRK